MIGIRQLAAASVVALLVAFPSARSQAQVVVFDPNNYAQNVLTAARALQQINNQITSLQNQAQMLINQARNLASLPYSSLQQLQQSIQRTQQLLLLRRGSCLQSASHRPAEFTRQIRILLTWVAACSRGNLCREQRGQDTVLVGAVPPSG